MPQPAIRPGLPIGISDSSSLLPAKLMWALTWASRLEMRRVVEKTATVKRHRSRPLLPSTRRNPRRNHATPRLCAIWSRIVSEFARGGQKKTLRYDGHSPICPRHSQVAESNGATGNPKEPYSLVKEMAGEVRCEKTNTSREKPTESCAAQLNASDAKLHVQPFWARSTVVWS